LQNLERRAVGALLFSPLQNGLFSGRIIEAAKELLDVNRIRGLVFVGHGHLLFVDTVSTEWQSAVPRDHSATESTGTPPSFGAAVLRPRRRA
jgi:hypothetical protein